MKRNESTSLPPTAKIWTSGVERATKRSSDRVHGGTA
jgi:hypothetical protein